MPIGAILGGLGTLAGSGLIRGTVGKLLRKGGGAAGRSGGTAIIKRPPNMPTFPRMPGIPAIPGGSGLPTLGRRKGLGRKAAELIAAGIAFEAGGKLYNRLTGEEIRTPRRMNYANIKALKRSTRRLNGAAKMYAKVLTATKGKRCGGYTIKPKGKGRRCA